MTFIGADFRFEVGPTGAKFSWTVIGGGSGQWLRGHHGECGARAYNGGLGAEPPAGSRAEPFGHWMSNGAGKFSPFSQI